ncbi:MAG: NAD(P)-dependent oxidoreductase [Bacillota bacterium]|nr:NAD(P)-dependent oxidoreductase [Bacillota bacterium]
MKLQILLRDPLGIAGERVQAATAPLREAGHLVGPDVDPAAADVFLITNRPLTAAEMAAAERLRFVAVAFAGYDHVDLAAATARGILVANARGYANQAVAELAVALMIAGLRRCGEMEARLRAGGDRAGFAGLELGSQTVGFIGTGSIGRRTAALVRAFGARTVGLLRRPEQAADPDFDCWLPLEELLAASTVVSLHCPLNAATRGLIGAAALERMRPGALLVNTARGPVVDQAAVVAALESGRLGAYATDVFEREPPLDPADSLLRAPGAILLPHIGYASQEALTARLETSVANILAWAAGCPENLVN